MSRPQMQLLDPALTMLCWGALWCNPCRYDLPIISAGFNMSLLLHNNQQKEVCSQATHTTCAVLYCCVLCNPCRYDLPIISAGFNMSVMLHDNHPAGRFTTVLDCSHYCHPGLPEVWISAF